MNELDEVAVMLRSAAGDYIAGQFDPATLRDASLQPRVINKAQWTQMAEMGWLGICLPESLGGSGLGLVGATVLSETFGRTLFPAPLAGAVCMPSELLRHAADDGKVDSVVNELAELMITGKRVLNLAWQEHPGQIDSAIPDTRVHNGRISGGKVFVAAAEKDAVLLVHTNTANGEAIVTVSADAAGVFVEQVATGLGAVATVTFDDAPLMHELPLLSEAATAPALEDAIAFGRIVLSAQLAGLATGCLEKNIAYVNQRIQFNRPIGSFQTIQHRCVDLHMDTMLAHASWRNAAQMWQEQPGTDAAHRAVSVAKARCGDVAVKVAKQSVQMHGAMGFAEEVEIGFYLRASMQGSASLGSTLQHRRRFSHYNARINPMENVHAHA